ncbi:MAG: tetratricopeptide repeat protein [Deltaproteobacteria bacterium]|nr:tetratricopeptide repeat protein [Deltaproteobacteria bacterium]
MKKYFSPQEVARLVGISDARVRYWTRLGLVPCRRRPRRRLRYDFQGLVALRTIKDLRHQGVSLRHLRTCVEKLKKRHPDITAPLAQVRFAATRRRIIAVARQQRWFTPEGQLHLDFPREAGRVIPLPGADPGALFFQALDCERQGAWEEAREKYAAILAVRPDHPDALVNLGNILYRWRFPEGAEMHYRRALEADPEHVEANFNLANLLEEKGRLEEAVAFYQKALKADPWFPEACFNLARTLEKRGNLDLARQYWLRYLALDPEGEWAEYLRQLPSSWRNFFGYSGFSGHNGPRRCSHADYFHGLSGRGPNPPALCDARRRRPEPLSAPGLEWCAGGHQVPGPVYGGPSSGGQKLGALAGHQPAARDQLPG